MKLESAINISDRIFISNDEICNIRPKHFFWAENNERSDMPAIQFENYKLIILVGSPASGKSTFVERNFKDSRYVIVSNDDLGRRKDCIKIAKETFEKDTQSIVVVDNTNATKKVRSEFVGLNRNGKSLCIFFNTSKAVCHHNNMYRFIISQAVDWFSKWGAEDIVKARILEKTKKHVAVPPIAINKYWINFEEPKETEGFDIFSVPFIPSFETEFERKLWKMHLD